MGLAVMHLTDGFVLAGGGLISGILAGLFGIGGGVILVPLLVTLGYVPLQSVATSSLAILVTSISGSVQNWRMGYFNPRKVFFLGLPALITAQFGVLLASQAPPYLLLFLFGLLLLVNIYLIQLRQRLVKATGELQPLEKTANPGLSSFMTGSAAGILAGLFGVGGGVIMVPLQMLLLGEAIKVAIQTSLAVIVLTAISACVGHAIAGNIQILPGLLLGLGGLVGVQISTRMLPKLPDRIVSRGFRIFLVVLSMYMFWEAWKTYHPI